MPTLLAVNNYHYRRGGAEVVFLEQKCLFENLGWDVPLFCMHHPQNLGTPWSEYFVDEVEFGRPYSFLQKTLKVSKAVYSFEACGKMRRLLDGIKPDIAHCHNIYHHLSPAIFKVIKSYDVPLVVTLHDLKLACPAYTMLAPDGICERCKDGALYNVVWNRCMKGSLALSSVVYLESTLHRRLGSYSRYVDRFVVPSRFYLHKFVEWGWDADRFVHIPNFVNVAGIAPDYSPGDYFLYFGRLSAEKGCETLVKAAAAAGVRLCLAGAGPQESELRRLAQSMGVQVRFLGFLSGEDLYGAIRAARATVLASMWYENAPLSILESYACGKPVIGASCGGIPELIKEGETGVTFPMGSVDGLATALELFQSMPDHRVSEMGHAGRLWMESDFTVEHHQERLLRLYRSMGVVW